MAKASPRNILIDDHQAELLVSPIRSEILMALITLDRASINELAEYLGRSSKALYHHMRPMIATGLAKVVETRRSGARTEAVYAPLAQGIRLPKTMVARGVESGLKLAIREAKGQPPEATQYLRIGSRLSESDLVELQAKLREIGDWTEARHDPKGRRVTCSAIVTILE